MEFIPHHVDLWRYLRILWNRWDIECVLTTVWYILATSKRKVYCALTCQPVKYISLISYQTQTQTQTQINYRTIHTAAAAAAPPQHKSGL